MGTMRPQVLVYETDGRLASLLSREAKPREWSLKEPRSLESCLKLLTRNTSGVLVLKAGKDLIREFTVLERVSFFFPETALVVVCDTENPVLASLAWDLGAGFVLVPPRPRGLLIDIVRSLVQRTVSTSQSTSEDQVALSDEEDDPS
jgi:hypothetical protein